MAQIKSQKKRILTNEKSRIANVDKRSQMRTAIKKMKKAVEAGNKEEANKLLNAAISEIDNCLSKGIIKLNSASRKKSSCMKLVASMK